MEKLINLFTNKFYLSNAKRIPILVFYLILISFSINAQEITGCGSPATSDSNMRTKPRYGNNEILDTFIIAGEKRRI